MVGLYMNDRLTNRWFTVSRSPLALEGAVFLQQQGHSARASSIQKILNTIGPGIVGYQTDKH